jgi:hypothetical protein
MDCSTHPFCCLALVSESGYLVSEEGFRREERAADHSRLAVYNQCLRVELVRSAAVHSPAQYLLSYLQCATICVVGRRQFITYLYAFPLWIETITK